MSISVFCYSACRLQQHYLDPLRFCTFHVQRSDSILMSSLLQLPSPLPVAHVKVSYVSRKWKGGVANTVISG